MKVKVNVIVVLFLTFVRCSSDPMNGMKTRKLASELSLMGTAEGQFKKLSISCGCNQIIELKTFSLDNEGNQIYKGNIGGDFYRTILDSNGDGISLWPDTFGEITLTVFNNDSVYLFTPINSTSTSRFYRSLALLKGKWNFANKKINGKWKCAPFDINNGGWTDLEGEIEGEWVVKPLN